MEALQQEETKPSTLRDALREGLHSCGVWEIRLESTDLPVTLDSLADVYLIGSRPWASLVLISCEDVNNHFNQFFGLSKPVVVDEGENVSTHKLIAPEDAPEGADALDRPDDDSFDGEEYEDEEEDEEDDSIAYVEPTPEQYEQWAIDILEKKILPRCLTMISAGLLFPPDNGN